MKGISMNGGSGLFLNANDKESFEHFLLNSTAHFLKTGTFGMTYILTLNPGVESKYLSLDASTYGQPVRQLLLKTIFVYPLKVTLNVELKNGRREDKSTNTSNEFYEEVNIQTDVYLKTMQYLEPLCPAIVYANIVHSRIDPLFNVVNKIVSTALTNDSKRKIDTYPGMGFGLIGMELMSSADTLCRFIATKKWYESYIAKAYHTLIEFVIQTGYTHGDFHCGNFLLNNVITNYFWGKRGKVTIIDFGFAEKLSQKNYAKIKKLYNEQKYTDILLMLCDIPRKDGYIMDAFEGYTSMCLKSQPQIQDAPGYVVNLQDMNNKIAELYLLREHSINYLTKNFTAKQLPLGNSAKNEMYNGFHFDKKFVNGFERVYPLRNMNEQVIKILNNMNWEYSIIEQFRLQVSACYALMYLLNNNFRDALDTRFAAMVYAGVFEGIDDKYVFRFASPYVSESALKIAIEDAIILEDVRFNNFLDYFTDSQLTKITQQQLTQVLNGDTWQINPEEAANNLKIAANIPTKANIPVKYLTIKQGFEQLPFNTLATDTEEPISRTRPPAEDLDFDGHIAVARPSDALPRPPFVNFMDPGFKKKKQLVAGKVRKTKRKQNRRKGMSRRKK